MNLPAPLRSDITHVSAGLIPTNMTEAMRLADVMASAKLVPLALQKSPGDCLMVIQQAVRWEMDPFAVAQECSVIQGKLMHSGKLVAAVVNARGNLTERLSYSYEGEGDKRTITVSGRLRGELEARTVGVMLKDARTNNRVWQTQPDQQLMYHGVRVWARRHTPELMLGVYSPEEFDEQPKEPRKPKAPAPNVILHDPETGEIEETAAPKVPAAADAAPVSDEPQHEEAGAAPADMTMDEVDAYLGNAAKLGLAALRKAWSELAPDQQKTLKAALERRHKPAALKADEENGNA